MTDGNGEPAARGGGNDEEAVWLDLIGRFDAPAGSPDAPVPWPDRENLGLPAPDGENGPRPGPGPGDRAAPPEDPGGRRFGDRGPGERHGLGERCNLGEDGPGERGPGERRGLGESGPGDGGTRDDDALSSGARDSGPWPSADTDAAWPSADTDGPWPSADTDGAWSPADADGTTTSQSPRWPSAGDPAVAGEDAPGEGPAGTGLLPDGGPAPDRRFVLPGHRPLDLPSPAAPRSWSPPGEDEAEEHYTPPPPPPLPTLAPGAKAAWTGLFGGPGYLLVATLAGWSVPGWALFLAIAAFVGGFTVLVLRQEPPDQDSGPDDGAVV
ncbi:MAG TPA: hypothetical protein VGM53_15470 [Streptosporangiaceae bacterium]